MQFELIQTDDHSSARAGCIHTAHGVIETPIFMPVGTAGTVKAVQQQELKEDIKAQIILGNTYHLFLRPGLDILLGAGGLHKFMSWDRPILTDSGGFQVYSLSANRKLTHEGAHFRSHLDGSKLFFSPENVVDTQRIIGADMMMAFDECTPYPCEYEYARNSMELTHQWLQRGFEHFRRTEPIYGYEQAYFPIVQGSVYKDLRRQSAEFIAMQGAQGNAIGGLSVGEPSDLMYELTDLVCSVLPKEKPRYLMGVGTPENLLECISLGVDMFDCVMPTRNGRNGMLFTSEGVINIKNKKWSSDFSPLDPSGTASVDHFYTKAYLRHLFKANEILGFQIASIHNLSFYLWLVGESRKRILEGSFSEWKNQMLEKVKRRL